MLQFLHTVSFFHAAFEALAVNELRYLSLKEHKVGVIFICPGRCDIKLKLNFQYGVELDVPAATILSTFGLKAQVCVLISILG